ncbi:MAG: hypothetical protein L0K67_11785, partial [Brevibacterium sp.]|nr:hypothetical protein [Brevibacterium sp.]
HTRRASAISFAPVRLGKVAPDRTMEYIPAKVSAQQVPIAGCYRGVIQPAAVTFNAARRLNVRKMRLSWYTHSHAFPQR